MSHKPDESPLFTRQDALWIAAAFAILFVRLLYESSYFPAYFWGEEARILKNAEFIRDTAIYKGSWLASFKDAVPEYNKGYLWFAVPFFTKLGWDVRIPIYLVVTFVSLWGGYLFYVYRKANDKASALWSFLLIACFAVFAVSVRRYKWHTMAYPGILSVYLFFLPEIRRNLERRKALLVRAVALGIFGTASFFYFGNIIYTVPFVALLMYFAIRDKRRHAVTFSVAFAVGVTSLVALSYKMDDVWAYDLRGSVVRILTIFNPGQLSQRLETVRHFTVEYLSWPYKILLATGLIATAFRIARGDRFALVNAVMVAWLFGMQFIMWGIDNLDCLNWSMVPLLFVLLTGAETIRDAVERFVPKGAWVFAGVAALAAFNEVRFFPYMNRAALLQTTVDPANTSSQAAVLFRSILEEGAPKWRYYLPDPSMKIEDGGFEYETNLKRVDYQPVRDAIVYFTDEQDLAAKLAAAPADREKIVCLSTINTRELDDPASPFHRKLFGIAPERLTPFKDIYKVEFAIRKYTIPATTTAPAAR